MTYDDDTSFAARHGQAAVTKAAEAEKRRLRQAYGLLIDIIVDAVFERLKIDQQSQSKKEVDPDTASDLCGEG